MLAATLLVLAPGCPQETPPDEEPSGWEYFLDPEDGHFDVSRFLLSRTGFLPVVIPITEPAVGAGLTLGLAFFHGPMGARGEGEERRLILPSTTLVAGFGTENDSYGGALGHLGVWDEGRLRYLGGAGYGSLNLHWFGKGDQLPGEFSYEIDALFVIQQLLMQLGESSFLLGPRFRYLDTESSFTLETGLDIPPAEIDSRTSGLGLVLNHDTRDNPFSPAHGSYAELSAIRNAEALGGDFDYWKTGALLLEYLRLAEKWILGLRFDAKAAGSEAPFYDLAYLSMRGIPADRYADDCAALVEAELRWDLDERWTLLGFGGIGRVADSFGALDESDDAGAVGTGLRYLVAREFNLRMGLDVARGPEETAIYVSVGTGWLRP